MNNWKYAVVALMFLLGSCHQDQDVGTLMVKPMTSRPIVTLVPVMDQSRHNLSWNVSHELTRAIRQRLTQHDRLYLLTEEQVYAMTRKSGQGQDPFGKEMIWVKKAFPQNEFVAFFELLEHREIPLSTPDTKVDETPAELTLAMRVCVVDLRGDQPEVILQEIVEQSHHIPKQFTHNQFNQVPWGDEMFEISPLGLAHEKLCQELSSRVEDYILLSCKKK